MSFTDNIYYHRINTSCIRLRIRLVRRDLSTLANFIERKHKSSFTLIPSPNPVPVVEKSSGRVKLPRFEIKKFNGDPTRWKSFIESFDAAVHANEALTDIEKMNFLVNYVENEAENVIEGLMLSNDNYSVAKTMLEERYGDPHVNHSAHGEVTQFRCYK